MMMDAAPARRAVLVLGMHRSGTSALTRVLALHGLALPARLMTAKPENPRGFWEAPEVAAFNDSVFAAMGLTWDDPRPLPAAARDPARLAPAIEEAAALLGRILPGRESFVLKDPRICRLLPVWLPALALAGARPCAVLAVRNPMEVAASLATRNGMAAPTAHALWLAHVLEAEAHTRALPRCVVHFDDLLRHWRGALRPLRQGFGLGPPQAEAIEAFLAGELRHELGHAERLLRDPSIPVAVKRVYAELRRAPFEEGLDASIFDTAAQVSANWRVPLAEVGPPPASSGA